MFTKDCMEWRDDQTMHVAYKSGAVPQFTAELCFVNTRVNFAQGTSLLEMLRGEIIDCKEICAVGVRVIHFTTKGTEISTS